MERLAHAAGARFEERDGWNVAVSYGGDTEVREVGFADCSQMVKLELHGERQALTGLAGAELELGLAVRSGDAWWCPVTPSRVLVLGEQSVARELRAAVSG